jgi:hypothetical protein
MPAPRALRAGRAPVPARDPERFAPVFVLAPARSFSSVTTAMIGQHPELAGLPELKLFATRTVGELEAPVSRYWIARGVTHRSPGLVRALAQLEFGEQSPEAMTSARSWLRARRHWSGPHVLDVLLARLAPRIAVEKSPDHVLNSAMLRRIKLAYPRARYLHLTRHPVTTQASMMKHWIRTLPTESLNNEPMNGIAAWLDAHLRILRFTARLPADHVMRMRAEDVLNDPAVHLRRIARWLGVCDDKAAIEAMRHPEASPFARENLASGVHGGHDPNFLRDPIPRRVALPLTVEQPPGWQGEAPLWQATVALAHRLGYPTG